MAKKKTSTRRPAAKSGARRRTARKPATSRKKAPAARKPARAGAQPQELRLSDLRRQINRALAKIDKVAEKDPAKYDQTRVKLASWAADIDDMCDPENPFGCGPDMVFPT